MKQFVAVIGNRNSGKSTVIKSLTGCSSSSYRGFVHDDGTKRRIYVICSSPQELKLNPSKFRKIIEACVSDSFCQGLVMAIQPTHPTKRLSLEGIIAEVSSSGAFQLNAFLLNPGRKKPHPNTLEIVSRLKRISVRPEVLDGRRFSHINATIINRKTHIVN